MLFGSARPRRQHAFNYFPLPSTGLSFACAHLWIAIESHFQTLMPAFSFQLLYPSASKPSVKRRPQKHTSFFCVLSFSTQKLIPHTAFFMCRGILQKHQKSFQRKRNVPGRSFYRRASFGGFHCLRNSESALRRLNLHQYTASVVLLCCLPLHMSHQCTCLCLHITADSFFKICNQLCLHLLRLRHSVAE